MSKVSSSSLKVLSKVKVWFSTYLVIPSTLNLGSCTLICGLAHDIESISPPCSYFLKIGLFLTQTVSFIRLVVLYSRWRKHEEIVSSLWTYSYRSWFQSRYLHFCHWLSCSRSSLTSTASSPTSSPFALLFSARCAWSHREGCLPSFKNFLSYRKCYGIQIYNKRLEGMKEIITIKYDGKCSFGFNFIL